MLRFDDCKQISGWTDDGRRIEQGSSCDLERSVCQHRDGSQNSARVVRAIRTTNESAKEIARNELCRGLVERLQLAEREAAELADLVVLAREP